MSCEILCWIRHYFHILASSVFHSAFSKGCKNFLKKLFFTLNWDIIFAASSLLWPIRNKDIYIKQGRIQSFLGRPVHMSKLRRRRHGLHRTENFSKFVPPDALKVHSRALSVLRFLCKIFSKLLQFTLQNTLRGRCFLKNSYIQIKNLCDYKLVWTAMRSQLKRCSK